MATYVFRDGKVVEAERSAHNPNRSAFPSPRLSKIEPYESPVTGKEITSWRARDRDMAAADAVDPRDLPANPSRGRAVQKKEAEDARRNRQPDDTFKWGGVTA